ncbi:MAG: hypothetical protein AAGA75_05000 [Cyanobacteria bacterium P01_E01_bin.6]
MRHPYKFSYPEQVRIYQRLNHLVGPGAAAFYKDACCLMEMENPFETTTHLVGHLLREIESSLRAVLRPILENPGKGHVREVLAVLEILEISDESTIGQTWLGLADQKNQNRLPRFAHREDLAPPRIIDENFKDFWKKINELLDEALNKFETHAVSVREKLDMLLKKTAPSKEDLEYLRLRVPNSVFALGYFFDHLESSKWLKPLYDADFFNNPPELELDPEGKTFRFTAWAQSRYLVKVAVYEPEIVLEISTQLLNSGNKNIQIYEDLAEAALNMPAKFAARWVEKLIPWLRHQPYLYYHLPDTLGELIIYLAHENQADAAIKLAQELLVVFPQENNSLLKKTAARFDEYYYDKIIKESLHALAEQNSEAVLSLLCDLLNQYLSLSCSSEEKQISEDHSSFWFSVSNSSSKPYRIDGILAENIWSNTIKLIESDSTHARHLFHKFQNYPWRVFDRFSLHLLRRCPEQLSDLVIERLTNHDRLEWLGLYLEGMGFSYSHEQALLLKEQFANLPSDAQKQILQWLQGDPVNVMKIEAEKRGEYTKYWQRDWFSIIENHLPENLHQLYTQLVQEMGEANSLDSVFSNTDGTVWSGPNSPKSGAELSEMAENNIDELFTYLKEWQPSGNSSRQSRNDLAWELADKVITLNPQQFVDQIERFKELDPQFMLWLLRGLKKAVGSKSNGQSTFSWKSVLTFCQWMMKTLRDKHISAPDTHHGWSRICDAIVEVIDAGFLERGVKSIPIDFREQVWEILEPVTNDPFVTPGFTPRYEGSNMGPYSDAINAVRSKAILAIVRYSFWIRQDSDGNAKASQNFDDMPEVQQVLEWHLNPEQDPSSAIRAVYGKYFPYLLHIASDWTMQRVDQIFPEEPAFQWLFEAAWEGYLYNQVHLNSFNTLRHKYIYSITKLPSIDASSPEQSRTSVFLSKHLLGLFWYTLINLGESDKLLENFFAKAPSYPREEFMRGLSWPLLYGDEKFEIDEQLRQRLRGFLEWRISQARMNEKCTEQSSDLKYFGWIFASGKLGDEWAIAQLIPILEILGTVDFIEEVLKHFETLAPSMCKQTIQCLCLVADGDDATEWFRQHCHHHHCVILRNALESENEDVCKSAKDLINRLLARNLGDYRELLSKKI